MFYKVLKIQDFSVSAFSIVLQLCRTFHNGVEFLLNSFSLVQFHCWEYPKKNARPDGKLGDYFLISSTKFSACPFEFLILLNNGFFPSLFHLVPLHCFRNRAVDEALSDSRLTQSFFFCLKTVEVIAISAVRCNLLMPLIAVKRTPFWLSVIFPALFVYPDFLNGINAKVTARNTLWIT